MTEQSSNPRLDAIIAEYLDKTQPTESDRERLISQNPDLADDLRSFFADHAQLQQAAEDATIPPSANNSDDATIPPSSAAEDTATLPPAASSSGTATVGTRIRYFGDYELLEEIARGGMGVVYKAKQTSLNRIVALKMILAGQLAGDEDVQRFHAEAEAAANLDHPGIVPIYEFGEHESQHYFSMGYVEGESLADKIKDGPLAPREAAEYTKKVAEAVAFAHEHGVIHRDLKPANVLLDKNGAPKVTDFGLAKKIEGDSGLTATGQILGTPSYMPPEQASGKLDEITETADVYSLGAILYALLTGRPPFQADNHLDTLLQVLEKEPVSARQLNAAVPRDIDTICLKCLQKERPRRYGSANELGVDLDRWLRGEPILARPVSHVEKAWFLCKRRPALSGLVLALFLVLIVSTGLLMSQRRANQFRNAMAAVDNLQNVGGTAIPFAIRDLQRMKGTWVVPELEKRFSSTDGQRKTSVAYALAAYGKFETHFLLSRIGEVEKQEFDNLLTALALDKGNALEGLKDLAKRASATDNWELKARLAIMGMHLGDISLALDIHQERSDPTQQSVFVHDVFPTWHANLQQLADLIQTVNSNELRTGMCLAVGKLRNRQLGDHQKTWHALLLKWYVESPDSGIHNASGWALRQWNVELPELPVDERDPKRRDWKVTTMGQKHGFTMVRIPAGQFQRTDGRTEQTVTLSGDLWLSDVEVTVGMYQEFKSDISYKGRKPDSWWADEVIATISPTNRHPIQRVSWEDAILFCNWLSQKENRTPCYKIKPLADANQKTDGHKSHGPSLSVTLLPGGSGYRLPTEAEWEYACRTGATTDFCFGNDAKKLKHHAVFVSPKTELVGSKMNNRWGLFDMHGNVEEWCWDRLRPYSVSTSKNPVVHIGGPSRVYRGGSLHGGAEFCRAGIRYGYDPADLDSLGFRVAQAPRQGANTSRSKSSAAQ